jgi:hypothetical protein
MYTNESGGVVEALRQAVSESGKPPYRLALESGVSPRQMYAFVKGRTALNLHAAGRLMRVLGLELRPKVS